jgi:hypothetical protein
MTQKEFAGIVTLGKESIVIEVSASVNVPPQELETRLMAETAGENVSTKLTPVNCTGLLFVTVIVIVCVVDGAATEDSPKDFVAIGAPITFTAVL